jgi:hypothetical protein
MTQIVNPSKSYVSGLITKIAKLFALAISGPFVSKSRCGGGFLPQLTAKIFTGNLQVSVGHELPDQKGSRPQR